MINNLDLASKFQRSKKFEYNFMLMRGLNDNEEFLEIYFAPG